MAIIPEFKLNIFYDNNTIAEILQVDSGSVRIDVELIDILPSDEILKDEDLNDWTKSINFINSINQKLPIIVCFNLK